MSKVMISDPAKCTGCRICELSCSMKKTGTCNPSRARIAIIKWEEKGINIPAFCQQCQEPQCMAVCPVRAIDRDSQDIVKIDQNLCIGCRMCITACPFGALSIDAVEKKIIMCDRCQGEPACAGSCPTGAIEYIEADRVGSVKKRAGIEKLARVLDKGLLEGV